MSRRQTTQEMEEQVTENSECTKIPPPTEFPRLYKMCETITLKGLKVVLDI